MNEPEKSVIADNNVLKISFDDIIPFILEKNKQGIEVLLKVNGISMKPFLFPQRDSACFVSPENYTLRCGDILLFRMPTGKYVMHRLCRINEDSTYDFVGDNNFIPEKNISNHQLIAYVSYVIRKGKKIDCTKGIWRHCMVLYMKTRILYSRFRYVLKGSCNK